MKILKSKFYLANPWKKIIYPKPYPTAKKAQWEGRSEYLDETSAATKGSTIPSLLRKGFKVTK